MSEVLERRRLAQRAWREKNPTYYRDKMAERKAAKELMAVQDVFAKVLVNEFVQVSYTLGSVRKTCLPYVVWANREDKLSFHIIAHDDGMICRNNKHMVEFTDRMKANLLGRSKTGTSEAHKYVCRILGESKDFIDTGLVGKKMFSLRLPMFEKIAEKGGEIKKGSLLKPFKPEYTPARYESYFLQRMDIVWNSTKVSPQSASISAVCDETLSRVISGVTEKFPEFVLAKTSPDQSIVASFKRVAPHACRCTESPHEKIHDGSRGAFIVRSSHRGMDKFTVFCAGGDKPRKIYHVIEGVSDTSTTGVHKHIKDCTRGSSRYLYGSGCMIPEIPEDSDHMNTDIYVLSSYGTGKTKYISAVVEKHRHTGYVAIVSSRKSLSAKYVRDLGARSYEDLTSGEKFDEENDHVIVVQFDSLHRIPASMRFDVLIIDEPAALINHMQSNSVRIGSFDMSKPIKSVSSMGNQIALSILLTPTRSNAIMVLDNDLSDDIIDTFSSVRVLHDGSPIEKKIYINDYKPYTHVKAVIDSEEGSDVRMREHLFGTFLNENAPLCREGKHRGAAISCHTAKAAEKLYEDVCSYVRSNLGEGYLSKVAIYTGYSGTAYKREHFSDVNEHWKDKLVVIFTQTVSVGVSFDGPHFTHMYGDFRGMWHSITAVQTVQSLFRFRHVEHMYLAVAKPSREHMSYGKIITNKHQLAREIELLSKMTMEGVYGDRYISAPAHIHGQIQAITQLSETNDEAVGAIMKLIGKSFTNLAWVYDELVRGLTMSNPVAYIDYLLRKVGIKPSYVERKSFGATEEEIDKVIEGYRQAAKAHKKAVDEMRSAQLEECKAIVRELLEYDESKSDMLARYPNLAECMGLVEPSEPEPKKQQKRTEIEELDEFYTATCERSDKARVYTENERSLIRVYYAWKNIGQTHINDITLSDVVSADNIYMINQARESISEARKHKMASLARDPRLITLSHCRSILTDIWGFNDEAIRMMTNVRISGARLLSGEFEETLLGLATVANKLTGKRVVRGKVEDLDLTNAKTVNALINAYLTWCGASVVCVTAGKSRTSYHEIQWLYAPPEEVSEIDPRRAANFDEYTIVEWGL